MLVKMVKDRKFVKIFLLLLRKKTWKNMASLLYRHFCPSLKPSIALLWEHLNQLNQDGLFSEQHLNLGRALFEFSFDP